MSTTAALALWLCGIFLLVYGGLILAAFVARWRLERKTRAAMAQLDVGALVALELPPVHRCSRCDEPVWNWPGYPHTCKGVSAERMRAIIREEIARAQPNRAQAGTG